MEIIRLRVRNLCVQNGDIIGIGSKLSELAVKAWARHSLATMMEAFCAWYTLLTSTRPSQREVQAVAVNICRNTTPKENENSLTCARRGRSTLLSRHVGI